MKILLTALALAASGVLLNHPVAMAADTTQTRPAQAVISSFATAKPLLWQGGAGRKPVRYVPIEVSSVNAEQGGSFGIGQSASMEGAYPEARKVEGRVLDATIAMVALIAPAAALPDGLAKGQRAVLGLVDDKHVICVLVPPANVPTNDLAPWAAEQRCA